ncbi:LicD family-domain-containing protein [Scheffersomyces xylosifermentans]|uniref:LicD family-domain-containing protein n=1 Tax=Scheffersomyces xylosifermentans TaxID=1304137 RepID=UPI00315D10A7
MNFPRLYGKKLKLFIPVLFTISCILFSLHSYIPESIRQIILEDTALKHHRDSSFDPRRSTSALYSYVQDVISKRPHNSAIGTEEGIYFHWDDWVDLSPGNKLLNRYRQDFPSGKCDSIISKFASTNAFWAEFFDKKVLRGMANLYCLKEIPRRIFITTDDNMVEVPVFGKRRFGEVTVQTKRDLMDSMRIIQENSTDTNFKSILIKNYSAKLDIDPQEFIFNADEEIFKLQEKLADDRITETELEYLEFLEYSSQLVEKSDRYFKYPWIITDVVSGHSHHLAYPFFKRFIGERERQSVIHHMVRAWFQFAEMNGFASWLNSGSLIGWAYNGVNMPFDTDVDVHMPITQVDRMGRLFNNSIIVENPRFGNAKYYLEIAPTYTKQGNGENFIDGRFIDINSGLYIDISALQHTDDKAPTGLVPNQNEPGTMMVHCKNWNWHSLDELMPLRQTYFEGGSVYIPRNVSQILWRKYGPDSFTQTHYHDHIFDREMGLWVPNRYCSKKTTDRSMDETRGGLEEECDKDYLHDEYEIVHKCSARHKALNEDIDRPIPYSIEEEGELPILRKDPWDYYYDINYNDGKYGKWFVNHEVIGKHSKKKSKNKYIGGGKHIHTI